VASAFDSKSPFIRLGIEMTTRPPGGPIRGVSIAPHLEDTVRSSFATDNTS